MKHRLESPTPCALSQPAETAQAPAEFSAAHNLGKRITFPLELAIDEIASIILRYGLNEIAGGTQIIIMLYVVADRMTGTFVYNAPAFDILVDTPAPDTTNDIEAHAVDGLG